MPISFLLLHDLLLLYQISVHTDRTFSFYNFHPWIGAHSYYLSVGNQYTLMLLSVWLFLSVLKKPVLVISSEVDTFQSLMFLWLCKAVWNWTAFGWDGIISPCSRNRRKSNSLIFWLLVMLLKPLKKCLELIVQMMFHLEAPLVEVRGSLAEGLRFNLVSTWSREEQGGQWSCCCGTFTTQWALSWRGFSALSGLIWM